VARPVLRPQRPRDSLEGSPDAKAEGSVLPPRNYLIFYTYLIAGLIGFIWNRSIKEVKRQAMVMLQVAGKSALGNLAAGELKYSGVQPATVHGMNIPDRWKVPSRVDRGGTDIRHAA
jgi:hypothetical protein